MFSDLDRRFLRNLIDVRFDPKDGYLYLAVAWVRRDHQDPRPVHDIILANKQYCELRSTLTPTTDVGAGTSEAMTSGYLPMCIQLPTAATFSQLSTALLKLHAKETAEKVQALNAKLDELNRRIQALEKPR